jgi:hypothetical protein
MTTQLYISKYRIQLSNIITTANLPYHCPFCLHDQNLLVHGGAEHYLLHQCCNATINAAIRSLYSKIETFLSGLATTTEWIMHAHLCNPKASMCPRPITPRANRWERHYPIITALKWLVDSALFESRDPVYTIPTIWDMGMRSGTTPLNLSLPRTPHIPLDNKTINKLEQIKLGAIMEIDDKIRQESLCFAKRWGLVDSIFPLINPVSDHTPTAFQAHTAIHPKCSVDQCPYTITVHCTKMCAAHNRNFNEKRDNLALAKYLWQPPKLFKQDRLVDFHQRWFWNTLTPTQCQKFLKELWTTRMYYPPNALQMPKWTLESSTKPFNSLFLPYTDEDNNLHWLGQDARAWCKCPKIKYYLYRTSLANSFHHLHTV